MLAGIFHFGLWPQVSPCYVTHCLRQDRKGKLGGHGWVAGERTVVPVWVEASHELRVMDSRTVDKICLKTTYIKYFFYITISQIILK